LKIFTVGGKILKIFIPAENVLFLKQVTWTCNLT